MAYQEKQLQEISKRFQIYGEILHAETLKIGHINETYSATYSQGGTRVRYIHQKINKNVFKNPAAVMENVMRVTSHIRRKLMASGARFCLSKGLKLSKPSNHPIRPTRPAAHLANSSICSWISRVDASSRRYLIFITPGNDSAPSSKP